MSDPDYIDPAEAQLVSTCDIHGCERPATFKVKGLHLCIKCNEDFQKWEEKRNAGGKSKW